MSKSSLGLGPLALETFFTNPTIAELASHLESQLAQGAAVPEEAEAIPTAERGEQDLEAMLAELDGLSEEEVAALLAGEEDAVRE